MVEKSFYLYCNWEKVLNHITEEFYNLIILVTKKHLERPQMVKKKRKKEEKKCAPKSENGCWVRAQVQTIYRKPGPDLTQTSHRKLEFFQTSLSTLFFPTCKNIYYEYEQSGSKCWIINPHAFLKYTWSEKFDTLHGTNNNFLLYLV